MEFEPTIGKRKMPSSPSWSLEDTQDECSSIADLVHLKKEEISKKLFYAVNKQSLHSMIEASFMKPPRSVLISLKAGHQGSKISPRPSQTHPSRPSAPQSPNCVGGALLAQVRILVGLFESAYSRSTSRKELDAFKQANLTLLHVLTMACKADSDVKAQLSQLSSEEIAIALLTLSSKKVKISKNCFVELVGAFSNKDREEILKKERCYYLIVWLIEGRTKTSDALGRNIHLSSSCLH